MIKLKDFIDMCDISFLVEIYDEYGDIEGPIWEGYSANLLRDTNYKYLLNRYMTRWGIADNGTDEIVYVDLDL